MACRIIEPELATFTPFVETHVGAEEVNGEVEYFLWLVNEGGNGTMGSSGYAIGSGREGGSGNTDKSLALMCDPAFPGEIFCEWTSWDPSARNCHLETFVFNPQNPHGNFWVRRDGMGIGISDIRSEGLRIIHIDIKNFPVVLTRQADKVILTFKDDPDTYNYYYPPAF